MVNILMIHSRKGLTKKLKLSINKMVSVKLGIIPIIIIALFSQSCKNILAPEFIDVKDLKVQLQGFTSAGVSGEALFYNPNKTTINILDAVIDLSVDGSKITTLEQDFNIKVGKLQNFTVPIDVRVPLKDLKVNSISSALSMLGGEKKTLHFKGKIRVKVYGIAFSVPVDHFEDVALKL
jgi:LEA14-like dessication related protein